MLFINIFGIESFYSSVHYQLKIKNSFIIVSAVSQSKSYIKVRLKINFVLNFNTKLPQLPLTAGPGHAFWQSSTLLTHFVHSIRNKNVVTDLIPSYFLCNDWMIRS